RVWYLRVRPTGIKLVPQRMRVLEPRQASRHGSLGRRRHLQDGRAAVIRRAPGEDEIAVRTQDLVMSRCWPARRRHEAQGSDHARSAYLAVGPVVLATG